MNPLLELAERWEREASLLDAYGSTAGAAAARKHAAELLEAVHAIKEEVVTLTEAATASGYSKRRLRELVAEGKLENAGDRGRPRFRRGDLPTKPGRGADGFDPAAHARLLLSTGRDR